MDTTGYNAPIKLAAPAAPVSSGKYFTVVPTLLTWAGLGAVVLGIIHSNGWLFALGLIVLLPAALIVLAAPLTVYLGMRNMYRHPEKYETQITEDAEGNFVSIKWNKVR